MLARSRLRRGLGGKRKPQRGYRGVLGSQRSTSLLVSAARIRAVASPGSRTHPGSDAHACPCTDREVALPMIERLRLHLHMQISVLPLFTNAR